MRLINSEESEEEEDQKFVNQDERFRMLVVFPHGNQDQKKPKEEVKFWKIQEE
jgi:hypothetical protein